MPIERRALLVVRTAALAGFLAVSAGLFAVYLTRVSTISGTILDPVGTALKYIHWAPLWAVALYAVLLLWGVKNHRAALLFCLSIPAAIALPVLLIGTFIIRQGSSAGLQLVTTLIYPATWLLPLVAMIQAMQLRIPKRDIGWTGYAFAICIVGLYIWTAIINDFMNSTPNVEP